MIADMAAAFLFDLDGTLISSVASIERIWGRWAVRQRLDVAAFLKTIHGQRGVDIIRRLDLPGLDPALEAERLVREELDDVDGVVPVAGAERFLRALPPERWAIVTSSPLALALVRLRAAGIGAPPVLVASEDITRGKPAPDCFILGAERLGVDVRDCVVFEDAPAGIAAGEAAGAAGVIVVKAAGVGHCPPGSHPSIESFDELEVLVTPSGLRLRHVAKP